ncbi:MAG: UvrB/UvrC motif-containing protein, partial [Candidatus Aenigmarchaeota archaeon]|nr:UvrB/UvrC motif-containing protein [Candidatus Aenigmarchaeota archaeon]
RIVEEEKAEDMSKIPMKDVSPLIEMLEYDMNLASEQLEFEKAIELRDKIRLLKDRIGKTSK